MQRQWWLNHRRHLRRAASAQENALLFFRRWHSSSAGHAGLPGGNLSRSSSVRSQRSSGIWLRAAGWERLTASGSAPEHSSQGTQRPRTEAFTLLIGHSRPKGKAPALDVSCSFWLRSAPGHSWCLRISPYASLARMASQCT